MCIGVHTHIPTRANTRVTKDAPGKIKIKKTTDPGRNNQAFLCALKFVLFCIKVFITNNGSMTGKEIKDADSKGREIQMMRTTTVETNTHSYTHRFQMKWGKKGSWRNKILGKIAILAKSVRKFVRKMK